MTDSELNLADDYERRLQRLRAAIAEGEKGEGVPWTPELMDQLWREADGMRRRGDKPNPDTSAHDTSGPPGWLPAARTDRVG